MKTKLFLSAIALSIVGWCHAANHYTFTLYSDGCESANVIGCDPGQKINVSAIPENEHRHFEQLIHVFSSFQDETHPQ